MEIKFDNYIEEISKVLEKTITTASGSVEINRNDALSVIIDKIKLIKDDGKKIFFVGNGASCSMAEHMSHDFFQNADIDTRTCAETSHITAVSNDLSFDMVFAFKIERVLKKGDALVTISSSGNSPNIIKAIEAAKEKEAYVITLSGMNPDNKSRKLGDMNIYVPAPTYGVVESAHAVILHVILDGFLDKYGGGRH